VVFVGAGRIIAARLAAALVARAHIGTAAHDRRRGTLTRTVAGRFECGLAIAARGSTANHFRARKTSALGALGTVTGRS
jgi:hypothetical protein